MPAGVTSCEMMNSASTWPRLSSTDTASKEHIELTRRRCDAAASCRTRTRDDGRCSETGDLERHSHLRLRAHLRTSRQGGSGTGADDYPPSRDCDGRREPCDTRPPPGNAKAERKSAG